MKKIEKITMSVNYIAYHLYEYANDTENLKETLQEYLDEAWKCVENMEATECDALHIRDLCLLINMILATDTVLVF